MEVVFLCQAFPAQKEHRSKFRMVATVIGTNVMHLKPPRACNYQNLPNELTPTAPPILLTTKPTTQVKRCCRAPPMIFGISEGLTKLR